MAPWKSVMRTIWESSRSEKLGATMLLGELF